MAGLFLMLPPIPAGAALTLAMSAFRGERVAELAGCALQQLRRSAGLTLGPLKINVMLAIGTQQGCESWIRDLKYGGRFFTGQLM